MFYTIHLGKLKLLLLYILNSAAIYVFLSNILAVSESQGKKLVCYFVAKKQQHIFEDIVDVRHGFCFSMNV